MIQGFADEETETFYRTGKIKAGYQSVATVVFRKLDMLDAAKNLDDLRAPPGNNLEKLRGDRNGQYSIRINDLLRICFRWADTGPSDVEIVDYH